MQTVNMMENFPMAMWHHSAMGFLRHAGLSSFSLTEESPMRRRMVDRTWGLMLLVLWMLTMLRAQKKAVVVKPDWLYLTLHLLD